MPLFNDDGNIVINDTNKTSIIDRLRWYIAQGPGGHIPSEYSANGFEEIFFFFVYLIYIMIRIVGIVLLFLSSPIWGPIYFIIKLIKEHTKKMKSHMIKNECKKVVKDSHESYFLEPIKPNDELIIRITKLWAQTLADASKKTRALEYDGTAVMSSKNDPIKSVYLAPIKSTDDPITRMLKSWAHAEVFKDPHDVKEYHGIVRIDR